MIYSDKTVLLIDDSSKVDFGGGQQITLHIAKLLRANDVNIIFADYTDKSRYAAKVKSEFCNYQFVILKSRLLRSLRVPVILKRIFEVITLQLYLRSNFDRITAVLPADKSHLISYVASKKGLTLAYRLFKTYGIPYVFHAHLVEQPSSLQFKSMLPYLKNARNVICTSKAVIASYGFPPNAIMQYNPGGDTTQKHSKIRTNASSPFVVAYVGSLIPIKGVEYFIAAANAIKDGGIEFRLYGDGPQRSELMAKSGNHIRFMGFCSNINDHLRDQIDLLVLPTIIPEALSIVIIEAKSAGIPVITTNLGGQAEIIQDNETGILVAPKNIQQIKDAIMSLYTDLERYNRMAAASKESVTIFSPEKFDRTVLQTLFQ